MNFQTGYYFWLRMYLFGVGDASGVEVNVKTVPVMENERTTSVVYTKSETAESSVVFLRQSTI